MRRHVVALWAGLLLAQLAFADGGQGDLFPPDEYRGRLDRVLQAIGDGVMVLKGAPSPQNQRAFRQYNTFWYLTGCEEPNAVLLLDGRAKAAVLYVLPHRVQILEAEVVERGITRVRSVGSFKEDLRAAVAKDTRLYLQQFPGEGEAQSRDSFVRIPALLPGYPPQHDVLAFRTAILQLLQGEIDVQPAESVTDELRRVKSPREIEVMRAAARITARAIRLAIQCTRPGIRESALAGICEYVFQREGARCSAWTPIVASGPNMLEFHYMENSRTLQPHEMLLVDAGPDYHYYTSDITRCWSTSGSFPEPYAELYDKLVEVHKAGIDAVRPGNRPRDVTLAMLRKARELNLEGLLPVPGHYTGMAAHDVGSYSKPFEPGVVFNVEPLLLDRRRRIHLRLEDTVLCTENGPEVLTPLDILPWDRETVLRVRGSNPDSFLP